MSKGLKGFQTGENHCNWKGGISSNEKYDINRLREWRHKKGISKQYYNKDTAILKFWQTKECKKLQRQKYKALKKGGGKLPVKRIQMVYEDNIKHYGTLTCYLCLQPISFGKDHLEHRVPLSRGGSNEYNNLAVACQSCNCKKHARTENEFRKIREEKDDV